MTRDGTTENGAAQGKNSRQVRLDAAQKTIVKALIFRAMREGESLQDCLREAFEQGGSDTQNTLISNGGIFDAARAAARRKAKGR